MSHMLYGTSPVFLGMADSTYHVLNYYCFALNTENKTTNFVGLHDGSGDGKSVFHLLRFCICESMQELIKNG